jgi:hypothetical protein
MAFNTDPRGWTYAHMCRDEHVQIGHNDSEHEMCPLCQAKAEVGRLHDLLREVRPYVVDSPDEPAEALRKSVEVLDKIDRALGDLISA